MTDTGNSHEECALAGWLSAAWYSVTDDAARLQAWVNQAAVLGAAAKAPGGTYVMSTRLSIPAGLAYDLDLSACTLDFSGVNDYNGGPMVMVQNPAAVRHYYSARSADPVSTDH